MRTLNGRRGFTPPEMALAVAILGMIAVAFPSD